MFTRAQQQQCIRELRQALAPEIEKEEHLPDVLRQAFTLMRRLRPGDVRQAMLCHRLLSRQVRKDLSCMGALDTWTDLIRLLFEVIEVHGYEFINGRWIPRERVEQMPGDQHRLAVVR